MPVLRLLVRSSSIVSAATTRLSISSLIAAVRLPSFSKEIFPTTKLSPLPARLSQLHSATSPTARRPPTVLRPATAMSIGVIRLVIPPSSSSHGLSTVRHRSPRQVTRSKRYVVFQRVRGKRTSRKGGPFLNDLERALSPKGLGGGSYRMIFRFHSINFFTIGISVTSFSCGYITCSPPNCFLNRVTPAHG